MDDSNIKGLKALVLAAGLGTRLRPLTDALPKPLATVLNVPLIDAAVRKCVFAGGTDIAVNTHHLASIMADHVNKSFRSLGAKSLFVSHESPEILGTGGALQVLSRWWGESPLLVYNGDILSDLPLDDLVTRHFSSENLVTMAVRKVPPADGGRSVWADMSGKVHLIAKKADVPKNLLHHRELGFACAYIAAPALKKFLPTSPSFFDVILAFNTAIASGYKISAIEYGGYWADIGTPKSLWQTNLEVAALSQEKQLRLLGDRSQRFYPLLDSSIIIDPNSVIGSAVKIGAGARIENSVLLSDAVVEPSEELRNVIRGSGLNIAF